MIYFTTLKTPIGNLGLVSNGDYLINIFLPNDKLSEQKLHKLYPNNKFVVGNAILQDTINQLTEYFEGKIKHFTIKTKMSIPPFYNKALKEVSKIPYGETASYSDIAERLNNPKAVRAVGSANAHNPLPIIIPCHRIVSNNGRLGGYAGGLELKKYLIEFEKLNLKQI